MKKSLLCGSAVSQVNKTGTLDERLLAGNSEKLALGSGPRVCRTGLIEQTSRE